MSPKLPHLTAREVVSILEAKGFRFHHQRGSHAVYVNAAGKKVTVPVHRGRTVGVGVLREILNDADIDPNDVRV